MQMTKRSTSAIGTKRKCHRRHATSAFGGLADIRLTDVRGRHCRCFAIHSRAMRWASAIWSALPRRRKSSGHRLYPDRNGKAQRRRSASLAHRHSWPHRRPQDHKAGPTHGVAIRSILSVTGYAQPPKVGYAGRSQLAVLAVSKGHYG